MQGVLSVDELQVTPAKNQDTAFREPGRGAVLSVAFVIHELEDVPLQVRVRGPHGRRPLGPKHRAHPFVDRKLPRRVCVCARAHARMYYTHNYINTHRERERERARAREREREREIRYTWSQRQTQTTSANGATERTKKKKHSTKKHPKSKSG